MIRAIDELMKLIAHIREQDKKIAEQKVELAEQAKEIERLQCCGNCRHFNSDLLTENCDENDGDFRAENRCEKWK